MYRPIPCRRFSYHLEPSSTPYVYRRFRTLWRPYTQVYTLMYLQKSPMLHVETTTPITRTIHVTLDGNLKTPYFMRDYYYDDQPMSLRTKIFYIQEVPVRVKLAQEHLDNILRQDDTTTNNSNTTSAKCTKSNATIETTTETTTTTKPPSRVSCYVCGLDKAGIPDGTCHEAFDGDDLRYLSLRPKFKKHCEQGEPKVSTINNTNTNNTNNENGYDTDNEEAIEKISIENDKIWYGNLYRGGCFKRFLDVGIAYTERGCREKKPYVGASFASKRFAKLERVLDRKNEGCVFSPYASLTPFSKAISLYARYHVCVCKGKYCNGATNTAEFYNVLWIITFMPNFIF